MTGTAGDSTGNPVLPRVRGGLAAGDVLTLGGDCYGPVVNLAARLVKEAAPAGVVVDTEVHGRVEGTAGFAFAPLPGRSLKGFGTAAGLAVLRRG
jgi:adenylate cyclase